jgi:valyl-tRNA synthetase
LHQVYFHIQSDKESLLFESQLPTIVTLTKGCKTAQVVRDLKQIPAGCGSAVVTPTVALYTLVRVSITSFHQSFPLIPLHLQGLVDLDVEIAKADKKLILARLNLDKVVKVESQPGYEDTVPTNVRMANEDKACIQ